MLSCKEVAHLASDYLDKHADGNVSWKIRLHLLACSNCRRFIRHLKITKYIAPKMIQTSGQDIDAEAIFLRIKERINNAQG